jgi:RimJ/RimL family protein N-acetyltransferase
MKVIQARCGTLEPQVEAHAAEMFEVLSDPAIYEFEREPPPSVERLAAGFRRLESRASPDGRQQWLNWVIRLPDQSLAGYVQATILESGVTHVAYELSSRYWRRGIGGACVQAMMEELARSYQVDRFVAVLKAANFRSMGLLLHLGFEPADAAEAAPMPVEADELVMLKCDLEVSRPA